MRAVVAAPDRHLAVAAAGGGHRPGRAGRRACDLPPDCPSRDTLLCHIERRAIQLPDALAVNDACNR